MAGVCLISLYAAGDERLHPCHSRAREEALGTREAIRSYPCPANIFKRAPQVRADAFKTLRLCRRRAEPCPQRRDIEVQCY